MRPTDDIRRFIDKAAVSINPQADKTVLEAVLIAHEKAIDKASAAAKPSARSIIMRNSYVKLALAAVVILAVVLGLTEFLGPGGKSGVVWANVAQKVEASRGVIFRVRTTGNKDLNDDWPNGYITTRRSPLHSRTDWYRGGQVRRTVYFNRDAKTMLWVAHDARVYYQKPLSEQELQAPQDGWTNPQQLVDRFLSGKYKELGPKTVEGVLCEGIETTDPAVYAATYSIKSFTGRIWVSVETGYPVLVETEVAAGDDGQRQQTGTADQFQWDVEIGTRECETPIPPDYRFLD
jgi:hypothetical protein